MPTPEIRRRAAAAIRKQAGQWAAFVLTALLMGLPAQAGERSYSALAAIQTASTDGVLIQSPGEGLNRSIVLPYSKSTVVELPANVMDVIVSNPAIVEAVVHTSRRTVLIGKAAGQTNVYFYGHDGQELLNIDIRVERDINGLTELVRRHAPLAEIEVQSINNNLMLTGRVPNAETALKVERIAKMWQGTDAGEGEIVNLLSVEGKDQVMLKVRIVEMQRSVVKQMGFNLSAIGQLGESTVSLINNLGVNSGAGLTASGAFTNTGGGDLRSLSGALTALERVGLIRTLAEPTLVAISGETATFLAGGEFPVLGGVFTDQNGQLQRSFEFKSFGVSLGFTPVVLSEGLISLNISTEVSEPTTENSFETGGEGGDILGLRVRRADTVVELPAGGSLVIAGMIREEARNAYDGTPGLKDVPGLGALFRNRDSQTVQTELVVIVTPYLVDPTHPDKLQTPLEGFVPANDRDQLLLGRLNTVYGDRATPDTLSGPFGHVVD
ncbi:type II and III secretion system protein family protein [uncultured Algimonas sp.]|uniref:type II and III secretion system protein family protein n=1 Tax=uncultured Algimonas sp. TaxID=1547920 RepID=UPI002621142D|nr:type II and III secretion system protein family protein [uncultured Algimonas sp.]